MNFKLIGPKICPTLEGPDPTACPELFTASLAGVDCCTPCESLDASTFLDSSPVDLFIDAGFNFFQIDCKKRPFFDLHLERNRNKLILAARSESNHSVEETLENIHECYRQIGTRYIDIALLECTSETPIERIMEGMQTLLYEGKIKGVGLCGDLTPELIVRANSVLSLTLIQMASVLEGVNAAQKNVLAICKDLGISITLTLSDMTGPKPDPEEVAPPP